MRVTETSGLQWCGRVLRWDDEGWLGEYVALGAGRPGGEVGPRKHGGCGQGMNGLHLIQLMEGVIGANWRNVATAVVTAMLCIECKFYVSGAGSARIT